MDSPVSCPNSLCQNRAFDKENEEAKNGNYIHDSLTNDKTISHREHGVHGEVFSVYSVTFVRDIPDATLSAALLRVVIDISPQKTG
jgi:hypothetical protein